MYCAYVVILIGAAVCARDLRDELRSARRRRRIERVSDRVRW
jgi:hypothetical protein